MEIGKPKTKYNLLPFQNTQDILRYIHLLKRQIILQSRQSSGVVIVAWLKLHLYSVLSIFYKNFLLWRVLIMKQRKLKWFAKEGGQFSEDIKDCVKFERDPDRFVYAEAVAPAVILSKKRGKAET